VTLVVTRFNEEQREKRECAMSTREGCSLVQPGQEPPFNIFPWISLAIILVGLLYAFILTRRDPTLANRVGSIIADREEIVLLVGQMAHEEIKEYIPHG
jgi:hypothetical protein